MPWCTESYVKSISFKDDALYAAVVRRLFQSRNARGHIAVRVRLKMASIYFNFLCVKKFNLQLKGLLRGNQSEAYCTAQVLWTGGMCWVLICDVAQDV